VYVPPVYVPPVFLFSPVLHCETGLGWAL
jgi:hypothetical protein